MRLVESACRCGCKEKTYRCNHCGHKWSDKATAQKKEIRSKEELYNGELDDVKLSIKLKSKEEEDAVKDQNDQGQSRA